ncbi:Protein HflK [Geodia barretti]|uniref:Protein HflK n=1 Tax=Geodia barretti TaxID=519541 RepID=A0AA35WJC4_GEOBA|nr:Protein HflK [Geodia barretti]
MITGTFEHRQQSMVPSSTMIANLERYLFRVDDPGEVVRSIERGNPEGRTLKDATEAALRQVVGQRSIDDTLVLNREVVEERTRELLQQILDQYDTGIQVNTVALQTVRPPDQVRAAFDDVVNARVDKESRINDAKAFEQDRIPRAEGDAAQVVQAAEAFKAERIARATGEVNRFRSVLREYLSAPDVTRQRLYLEAMEGILPGIKKFILSEESQGSLLQFLPLTDNEVAGFGVAYTVDETEYVVITRFGEVQRGIASPGLKFKSPVESVVRFDKRLLRIDVPVQSMPDRDSQFLEIDAYVRYRIRDPKVFLENLRDEFTAGQRIGSLAISAIRDEVGVRDRRDIIGGDPITQRWHYHRVPQAN